MQLWAQSALSSASNQRIKTWHTELEHQTMTAEFLLGPRQQPKKLTSTPRLHAAVQDYKGNTMDFELNNWIENRQKPAPQKFGDPVIIRAGQELHVRDWIDSAREDTEIYPTLEKYGCIDRMIVNKEQLFGDLTQIMNLRDSLEQIKQANNLWESLPLDFRKEFLNDKEEFMRNGMDVLKKKIEAEKETQTVEPQPTEKEPTINKKDE